jgi:hypothetical protein
MAGHSAYDLVLRLAVHYALLGLFAAFTVGIVLIVAGVVAIPAKARKPVFGLYALAAAALVIFVATSGFRAPSDVAAQVSAAAESAQAFRQRDGAVLAADDPRAASEPTGTVYIQVPDMDARFAAEKLWRALTGAGFRSPGIEVISGRSPGSPEVRYFNDADRAVAERVAALAAEQGLKGAVVKTIANYKAPAGQIEFWYPRG